MNNSQKEKIKELLAEADRLREIEDNERIEFPFVSEKGRIETRVENTHALLKHYDITCRYNEMTKDIEIDIPDKKFHPDTKRNTQLFEIIDRARHHGISYKQDIDEHIQLISQDCAYHPIRDWIKNEQWDGVTRLPALYGTIESDTEVKELVLRKWLISCVAALFEPNGFKSEGLVVLSGRQGSGKTTWVKKLVPEEFQHAILDGAMLNPSDKDSVLNCVSHWIVELGELGSTFRKSDMDALKAFITKQRDDIRPPYARKIDSYARRTVFFGTVDIDNFLIDTENRRFWTLQIDDVNAYHRIELSQLWAEVYKIYLDGERWYLDRSEQELLALSNKQFDALTPVKESISKHIHNPSVIDDEDCPITAVYVGVRDLLIQLGFKNPTKAEMNEAAQYLKREGFTRQTNTKRFWVVVDLDGMFAINKSIKNKRDKRDNIVKLIRD